MHNNPRKGRSAFRFRSNSQGRSLLLCAGGLSVIKLRLSLPCPVNRMHFALPMSSGKKRFTKKVLSKEYREKRQHLVHEVWQQTGGKPQPMTGSVAVHYTITPRDRRTADVDAYEKTLLDGLQMAGVYLNDNQVVHVTKERLPNPEHPGHIDVTIEELPT